MKSPCKGCDRRKLLCHSVCERYKAFVNENEEVKKKKAAESDTYTSWKVDMKNEKSGRKAHWHK